jgi:hypothetical protein
LEVFDVLSRHESFNYEGYRGYFCGYAVIDTSFILETPDIVERVMKVGWRPIILMDVYNEVHDMSNGKSDFCRFVRDVESNLLKLLELNKIDMIYFSLEDTGFDSNRDLSNVDKLQLAYSKMLGENGYDVIFITRDYALYKAAKEQGVTTIKLDEIERFLEGERLARVAEKKLGYGKRFITYSNLFFQLNHWYFIDESTSGREYKISHLSSKYKKKKTVELLNGKVGSKVELYDVFLFMNKKGEMFAYQVIDGRICSDNNFRLIHRNYRKDDKWRYHVPDQLFMAICLYDLDDNYIANL